MDYTAESRFARQPHRIPAHRTSSPSSPTRFLVIYPGAPASGLSAVSARSRPVIINAANYSANSLAYLGPPNLVLWVLSLSLSLSLSHARSLVRRMSFRLEGWKDRWRDRERGRRAERAIGPEDARGVPLYRPSRIAVLYRLRAVSRGAPHRSNDDK